MKQFLLTLSILITCTSASLAATTSFGKLMPLFQTAIDNEVYGNSGTVRLVHMEEGVNLKNLSTLLIDGTQSSFSFGYEIDTVQTFVRLFPRTDDTDMSCETNEYVVEELTLVSNSVKLAVVAGTWTTDAGSWNVFVLVDETDKNALIFSEGMAE